MLPCAGGWINGKFIITYAPAGTSGVSVDIAAVSEDNGRTFVVHEGYTGISSAVRGHNIGYSQGVQGQGRLLLFINSTFGRATSDGVNFSQVRIAAGNDTIGTGAISYGYGVFACKGPQSTLDGAGGHSISLNGIEWANVSDTQYGDYRSPISIGPSSMVMYRWDKTTAALTVRYSTNMGVTWSNSTLSGTSSGVCIAAGYGNGIHTCMQASGGSTSGLLSYDEGLNFSKSANTLAGIQRKNIIYTKGHFLAAASTGAGVSTDGSNWALTAAPGPVLDYAPILDASPDGDVVYGGWEATTHTPHIYWGRFE
jgi:hypothetical protein